MDRRLFLVALASATSATLAGCAHPVYVDAPPGPRPAYYYDYYYYPDVSVYFHLFSGHYYFRDGKTWISAQILPPYIHLDHRVRHRIVIHDDRPYRHWHEHRKTYRHPRGFRADPRFDRGERDHNRRRHEEYRHRRRH